MGIPVSIILQMDGFQRLLHTVVQVLGLFPGPQAKGHVLKNRHVGPQSKVLKDKAKLPLLRRKIDFLLF